MNYNVQRGLREIVAPSHRMPEHQWASLLDEFSHRCAYCDNTASAANRGIAPDHLVAATDYGELVVGNTVPACQTCNDSRGNKNWQDFIRIRFPDAAASRIAKIKAHIEAHAYMPKTLESALEPKELAEYKAILAEWDSLLNRAQSLQLIVASRRAGG